MKNTLLLVFIHGFKGSDHTFHNFPQDLRALLSHALPKIDVRSEQYPKFETRGDLKECVAHFKEWLQNKVIDIEVEHGTPSPTVDPSVHLILCGHSMGGIVAAETLISIAKDELVPTPSASNNATSATLEADDQPASPSSPEHSNLLFPHVQAILAFDTPYLGISPGVLAHGAEEHFNQASSAYKAFDTASNIFGWNSPRSSSPSPAVNASSRGLPAPENSTSNSRSGWGKYAMYGGAAAAAVAGIAGAAYMSRNQITQGFAWAGSHLEFVGCLMRGAELQKRVESVVKISHSHDVGFANFYSALDEKVTSRTKNAGAMLGDDRTFCVVPKSGQQHNGSPTGTKRNAPVSSRRSSPKRGPARANFEEEMSEGDRVQAYLQDTSRKKGNWVKCVNRVASDEVRAHTSMFTPQSNSNYHAMLPAARDEILGWIDGAWYERSEESAEEVDKGEVDEEQAFE